MPTVGEIERAIENARSAGDEAAVRALTRALQRETASVAAQQNLDRNLGLLGRAAVEGGTAGVLGLPALAFDGTVGVVENLARRGYNLGSEGINSAFGTEIAPVEYRDPFATTRAVTSLGDYAADSLGLPEPESGGERLAFEGARGGISALTGAGVARVATTAAQTAPNLISRGLTALSEYPVVQTMAGAGSGLFSEYAGQTARAEGASPVVEDAIRVGASLIGGTAVGASPAVGRATLQAARRAADPLYAGGQERIVGNTLRHLATDPDEAAFRAATAPELVPGARPTLGQASRDPGLIGNENAIRSAIDQTNRFGQRASQNNAARHAFVDRITQPEGAVAALRQQLRSQTDTLLNQTIWPNSQRIPQQELDAIVQRAAAIARSPAGVKPEVRGAMQLVLRGMQDLRSANRLDSPEYLYSLRQVLAQARDGTYRNESLSSLRLARGELASVIKTVDDAIEAGAPGFKRYMDDYAAEARRLDSFDSVNDIRTRSMLTTEDPIAQMPIFSPAAFSRNFRSALRNSDVVLDTNQRRALQILGRDLQREASGGAQTVRVRGSDTAKNLSVAYMLREMLGSAGESPAIDATAQTLMRPISWIYAIPSQRMEELLVDAMLDPKFAADLMKRANARTVESIGRQLLQRLRAGARRSTLETVARDPERDEDPNRRPSP